MSRGQTFNYIYAAQYCFVRPVDLDSLFVAGIDFAWPLHVTDEGLSAPPA